MMERVEAREEFDIEQELENEFLLELADFFKIFGDGTRIRILQLLLAGEKNVGELAEALDMSQSAVSPYPQAFPA